MSVSKLQILIVFLAIGGTVLLYGLPKGIIKKEKEMPVKSENIDQASENQVESHTSSPTATQTADIRNVTKDFYSVLNKEKKVKFADSLITLYRRVNLFDSSAKYAEIAALLEPTSKRFETAGDAYSEAFALSEQGDKDRLSEKSRGFYNRVLVINPRNLEVKSKLALTYIGGSSPMTGIGILREVLKEDPKNETAIYNLGVLSMQSKQYGKAIDRFKELISINPANASAHFYLGVSYLNSGEKNKARIALKSAKALENDPAFQASVDNYLKELDH